MTARRLSSTAMAAGLAAGVLVLVAPSGDGGAADGEGDATWVLGLLLILAPLLAASVTRSVATSSLLRPVGAAMVVVAGLGAVVHVAVAGLAYGWPALVAAALLVGAVAVGPVRAPSVEPRRDAGGGDDAVVVGPPLDVGTPLRNARSHAAQALAAWLVVVAVAGLLTVPVLRLLGWPAVEERLLARVAAVDRDGDHTVVTFETVDRTPALGWRIPADGQTGWERGERLVAFLDDNGDVHLDQQLGLAGLPLVMPLLLTGVFAALALRRLWALAVARWDLDHGGDQPRLGFAAVIHDPAPRTWRPLVAVWERDPTGEPRLPRADAVYRADDETSEDLECRVDRIVVRRAWIDTGLWSQAKPRWIGVEGGVAVPHRRSLLGRTYVRLVTRRSEVAPVVALRHGPPREGPPTPTVDHPSRHSIGGMLAWRLPVAAIAIAAAFLTDDGGAPTRPVERRLAGPASGPGSDDRERERDLGQVGVISAVAVASTSDTLRGHTRLDAVDVEVPVTSGDGRRRVPERPV